MKPPVRSAIFAILLIGGRVAAQEPTPSPEASPSPSPSPSPTPAPDDFLLGNEVHTAPPEFFGEPGDTAQVTRSTERIEDAPGLIAVIGEREIHDRGYRTLADLLADVPGFYVERDARHEIVFTRGVPQSILVVYDGVPLIFDTGRTDLPIGEELSLVNVRRVEVLRGPGTALWGANAFNGIVNVISKDGRDLDGGTVRADAGAAGSAARGGLSMAAGRRGERLEWALSARVFGDEGERRRFSDTPYEYLLLPPVSIPTGPTRDGAGSPQRSLFGEAVGKAAWKSLTVVGRWSDFRARTALSSYSHSLLESDRNEQRRVPTSYLHASWSASRGAWRWNAGAFWLQSLHDDRYPLFARAPPHRFGGSIDVRGSSENAGVDGSGEITIGTQTISGGGLLAYDDSVLATDYVDPQTGTRTSNAFRRRFQDTILQVYAQDRILIGERARVTVGGSFDDQADFKPSLNPRAGLVLRLQPNLIGKALYGEAIRTPDQYDVIGISGGAAVGSVAAVSGNPDLRPEKIRTAELATEYRRGSIATGSIAAFASRADDLIEASAAGGEVTPVNRGRRYAAGIEALAMLAPTRDLALNASYTFVRTAAAPGDLADAPLPSAPESVGTIGGSWRPTAATTIYLGNRFVSRRLLRGEGDAARLGPYEVTDLDIALAPPSWRVSAGIGVKNLFDTHYWHRDEAVPGRNVAVEIPGDRRTVLLRLEGRF